MVTISLDISLMNSHDSVRVTDHITRTGYCREINCSANLTCENLSDLYI